MSFAPTQLRKLKARLRAQHVKTREADGLTLRYLEGWHVIAEANRIFGFDGWDRETVASDCVWTRKDNGKFCAAYVARVRITVRAGDTLIRREGCGVGDSSATSPGQAHELAAKAAETDATKRALATFGNAFGLSLYGAPPEASASRDERVDGRRDRGTPVNGHESREADTGPSPGTSASLHNDQPPRDPSGSVGHATHQEPASDETSRTAGAPASSAGNVRLSSPATSQRRVAAAGKGMDASTPAAGEVSAVAGSTPPVPEMVSAADDGISAGADLGEDPDTRHNGSPKAGQHVDTPRQPAPAGPDATGRQPSIGEQSQPAAPLRATGVIDKSALARAEPRRIRDPGHLRFVAGQPCLVCGRTPAQAHHLRFAQPRALARKVSDAFTVPLCALHHSELHLMGDEYHFWETRKLDPLSAAAALFEQSRAASATDGGWLGMSATSQFGENRNASQTTEIKPALLGPTNPRPPRSSDATKGTP